MKRQTRPTKTQRARGKPIAYDHSQLRWQVVKRPRGVAEEVKKFQPPLDLDFKGAKTAYATHAIHSFSAKFPPQLASWAIQEFTSQRETVIDPMAGSGTTLVEACLLGRNSYGIDIDPLARLISKVKSTPMDFWKLQSETNRFEVSLGLAFRELEKARRTGTGLEAVRKQITIPEFPNRDYWFLPVVSEELALLKSQILSVADPDVRDFLLVVFSSIIITKGKTSVANVMDLAHSRPHYAKPEAKPDTLKRFIDRLTKLRKSMEKFSADADPNVSAKIIGDDAKRVPLNEEKVDFVFTSPPYVNAIDYPRAHKFTVFWLGEVFGVQPGEYTNLGKSYIGTERVDKSECVQRVQVKFELRLVDRIVKELSNVDVKQAGIAHRYFSEMQQVLSEVGRVLKFDKFGVIVVGPSNIRGISVPTHEAMVELGESVVGRRWKLRCEGILRRKLDRDKRQLPVVRGLFGNGIQTEYLVVLKKVRL